MLSRDAILSVEDLPFEDVQVPEWHGTVRVRTMTGAERDEYDREILLKKDGKGELTMANRTAGLCAFCLIDESGARLFPNGVGVEQLAKKSSAALDRVAKVAMRLNNMGAQEVKALGKD